MPTATKPNPPPKEEEEEMVSKMISSTLPLKEHQEFKEMLMSFPKLFVRNYIDMTGVDYIQHQIELKKDVKPQA